MKFLWLNVYHNYHIDTGKDHFILNSTSSGSITTGVIIRLIDLPGAVKTYENLHQETFRNAARHYLRFDLFVDIKLLHLECFFSFGKR